MLTPSRAEAGNLRYDLWQDQAEPARFVLDELYRDAAAVAAHRDTAHFRAYLARINDLAERRPAERRAGKECVSTCRSPSPPAHSKTTHTLAPTPSHPPPLTHITTHTPPPTHHPPPTP